MHTTITADPAEFAVFCVTAHHVDVRRAIFDCHDLDLLRSASSLIEEQDGDERLVSWLRLRRDVLQMTQKADRVAAGLEAPHSRRKVPKATQPRLFATPSPATPTAEEYEGQTEGCPLELVDPTDPDLGTCGMPTSAPPAPDRPQLVDPRPPVLLPMRQPTRLPALYQEAAAALPWVLWFLRAAWSEAAGCATMDRRTLQRVQDRAPRRWGLDRWHQTAWAWGTPAETICAALGLEARFDRQTLTVRVREVSTAPARPASAS